MRVKIKTTQLRVKIKTTQQLIDENGFPDEEGNIYSQDPKQPSIMTVCMRYLCGETIKIYPSKSQNPNIVGETRDGYRIWRWMVREVKGSGDNR